MWSFVAQSVKNLPAVQGTWVRFLGWENPPEKEMATHCSILAWRTPWAKEPGGLQFMGSQESDMTEQLNHHHHECESSSLSVVSDSVAHNATCLSSLSPKQSL